MHRILNKNSKQNGFTLIELMIVVAIIGILAAVAIPQFLKMMDKSKSGEAELTLDLIKKGTKAQWNESNGFVPGAAAVLPDVGAATSGCCGANPDNKCTAEPDLFNADTVWAALDVRVDQNGYYYYDYTAGAAAPDQTMSAHANGDVNCNGTVGTYDLEGDKDDQGGPVFSIAKPGQTIAAAGYVPAAAGAAE